MPKYFLLYKAKKEELLQSLSLFDGYWKVRSMIVLKFIDFPILNGIIVTRLDKESKQKIWEFAKEFSYTELLIRHDRRPELPNAPRGGYIVSLKEIEEELTLFFKQDRIVVLFDPVSPYDDIYSCNALFDKEQNTVILEIVGPGFDASDLNRGDITPHEIFEYSLIHTLTKDGLKRVYKISNEEYKDSVRNRLQKIGRRISGQYDISSKSKGTTENSLEYFEFIGRNFLIKNNKNLLLQNIDFYREIPVDYLRQLMSYIKRFPIKIEEVGIHYDRYVVLSMGFLEGSGLKFWDMVIPERKYVISK